MTGPNRRTVLQGVAGSIPLLALAQQVAGQDAPDAATTVPPEARSVEAGLELFAKKWAAGGPIIAATRFGRFLTNNTINCRVVVPATDQDDDGQADPSRAYTLVLGTAGAEVIPGASPGEHADLTMDQSDWKAVLYGDHTGLAPILGGDTHPNKDQANTLIGLLLVMYILAHIPHPDADPRFTAETLRGFFQRGGVPECEGEPASFETFDRSRDDPEGEVRERAFGANDTPDLTRRLAEWVADLQLGRIPDHQLALAKAQLKNILGVTFAGGRMEPGRRFAESTLRFSGDGATIVGFDGSASPHEAAMANSFLAQVLEWEDWTNLAHSGAAVVPAALAAAEEAEATGEELLTAIVAGNEVIARVSPFMTDLLNTGQALPLHQIETPLVAGKLLGLSAEELQDAVGIATTQPQLTSIPAWTAGAKGMVTADPVGAGVRAALLADDGLTGRRDLLENPLGYCARISDVRSPRDMWPAVADLSTNGAPVSQWGFRREKYFNKRYPVDGFTLTAVQAMRNVRASMAEAGVNPVPDNVESIRVHMNLPMASTATMFDEGELSGFERVLSDAHPDRTYIELLFGGRFPLAATFLDGDLTDEQFRKVADGSHGDWIDDVRALWPMFEEAPDAAVGVLGAEVSVTTSEGGPFRSMVGVDDSSFGADATYDSFVSCIRRDVNGRNNQDMPLFDADAKFRKTAKLPEGHRRSLLRIIDNLDNMETIQPLVANL